MENKYIELKENLQSALDTQSRIALIIDTEWKVDRKLYNEQDLGNASLILMHILGNISAEHLMKEKWLTIEQAWKIATELWENIRQTIKLWTWIDMHNLFNKK